MATLMEPLAPADVEQQSVVKVVASKTGRALYFSRSAIPFHREGGVPAPVFRHIGLYAYRAGFLNTFVGWPPAAAEQSESLEQCARWPTMRIFRLSWHPRPFPRASCTGLISPRCARYLVRSNKTVTAGTGLTALNTPQLHASAERLVIVTSSDQLRAEIAALDEGAVPHVLGGGSNVILCDHLPGTTLLAAIKRPRSAERRRHQGGDQSRRGESWHDFVVWCHHQGFHGLANLALIPGSVGARLFRISVPTALRWPNASRRSMRFTGKLVSAPVCPSRTVNFATVTVCSSMRQGHSGSLPSRLCVDREAPLKPTIPRCAHASRGGAHP